MKKLLRVFVLTLTLLAGSAINTTYAGHTVPDGAYCICGCTHCVCDPGEHPGPCNGRMARQARLSIDETPDLTTGAMTLLFALFFIYAVSRR